MVAERLPKSRGRSLYTIGDDLLALEWLLLEAGGVLEPGEEEQIIDRWFSELRGERDKKLDDYAGLVRDTTARAANRKAEIDRMRGLAAADDRLVGKLKERLLVFLERTGETKIETTHFRIRRQNNGGKLALEWRVGEDRYSELPEALREERVTYVPRQDEVRAALDAALTARRERMERLRHGMLVPAHASYGGRKVVETIASIRGWADHEVRHHVRDVLTDASDLYDLVYHSGTEAAEYVDAYFPPTEAEQVLAFVDYKPRGQQVRIE